MKFISKIKENLLVSVITFVVAFCSIAYELIYSQMLTVIYGGTVARYSITIGIFLFSLGLGALFFKYLKKELVVRNFLLVELILALIGPLGVLFIVYINSGASDYFSVGLGLVLVKVLSHLPIVLVGFLSGLEIPLLAILMKTNESFADVLGIDYFGSLAGTVVYALWLYPNFGLISAVIFIGFLNVITAVVIFGAGFYEKRFARFFYVGILLVLIYVFALLNNSAIHEFVSKKYLTYEIEKNYIGRKVEIEKIDIIEHFTTPYQEVTKYEVEFGEMNVVPNDICINLDSHLQMCESWVEAYHYGMVEMPMAMLPQDNLDILVVGGGDFIGIDFLRKYDKKIANIDQVDIDEKFMNFAKNDPFVLSHNNKAFLYDKLNVVVGDAYSFLKDNNKEYDLIILDLPGFEHDKLIHLASIEFYTFLHRGLKDSGLLVSWIYPDHTQPKHNEILLNTVSQAGFKRFFNYPAFNIGPKGGVYVIDWFNAYSKNKEFSVNKLANKYVDYFSKYYEKYDWEALELNSKVAINSIFKPNYGIVTKFSKNE